MGSRGFSLLEAIFMIAIVTTGILGGLHWSGNLASITSHLNGNERVASLMETVTAALASDDRFCTSNFSGLRLQLGAAGTQVTQIRRFNDQAVAVGRIMAINESFAEGFVVSDIRLRAVSRLSVSRVAATLDSTIRRQNSSMTYARSIPVQVEIDAGGIIRSCSANVVATSNVRSLRCELEWGGSKFWDVRLQECVDNPNIRIFPGNANSARCGAGYRPAVPPSARNPEVIVCTVAGPNTSVRPRTYSNGFTSPTQQPIAITELDFASATCTFDHPNGVNLTGVTSSIRCAPIGATP